MEHIPPLVLFLPLIAISVRRSNFTLVFFKAACHTNPGVKRNFTVSSSYILGHMFLKFSNTSGNNSVSLWTNKSWYSPKFFFQNLYKLFLRAHNLISNIFRIEGTFLRWIFSISSSLGWKVPFSEICEAF